jgi:hypothetical protein
MPDQGALRIARNPGGRDFPPVRAREPYRAHAFVGGNAFMLDLLRANHAELGLDAPPASLQRTAELTRAQLAHDTATLRIEDGEVRDGRARFVVHIENHTGHRFPTGYPARRAWLHVVVRQAGEVLFESGGCDDEGRILGLRAPFGEPHHLLIERADQVQIYEMVAADAEGEPTTSLVAMASRAKDNRLLPRGHRPDGPHAEATAPAGVEDPGFTAGRHALRFAPLVAAAGREPVEVQVELLYQPVPPAWVDGLRKIAHPAAERFVRLYDAADRTPERVAVARAVLR